MDVKFASGLKNINLGFYPYIPESCDKISQAYYLGGIRTHNPCNFRAVFCQLDYQDCPVARGGSNTQHVLSITPILYASVI